jgi:uncharacterized protein YggU (UPF0235/DUF167 family)
MTGASPFTATGEGVRIAIRLTPKSSRDSLEGLGATRDGRPALAAKVRAAPEKGAANAALLALVARSLDLAPSRLSLVAGAKDRHKTVLVSGPPEATLRALEDWLKAGRAEATR